ncbi:hypothetical protein Tco_0976389 [Tanacetum coccineum]|uniref:Clathrin light chain n=1 Tax=Tanacetum coccineum TaxID=301880 RepID=A0ABQ5EI84_9ASTR
MVEPEKPLKKKDQILIDEEIAQKLQAQLNDELEEEEKLAKQREEDANIAEWDNVQAMIDADYELAARLQAQEQKVNVEEKTSWITLTINLKNKSFDEHQGFDRTNGLDNSFVSDGLLKWNIDREELKHLDVGLKANNGSSRQEGKHMKECVMGAI